MTASAKEVIAAAIPEALADITYAEDDGGLGVDGWIYLSKLSAAILAALDAAGFVVVPREPTEAADVIDALVAALERAANEGQNGQLSLHTLMACGDALAMARKP